MRLDKKLDPAALNLTRRQHFFLCAWFNLGHWSSLDSYRVRVMNPINILREFSKMYEPQADDNDRRMVGEELLEILSNHPVLASYPTHYNAVQDTVRLLSEVIQAPKKSSGQSNDNKEKSENLFKRNASLIQSFVRELIASLEANFLSDSFDWLAVKLAEDPAGETNEQELSIQAQLEHVCRDIFSVVHDAGFSLEALYSLYKLMSSKVEKTFVGANGTTPPPYDFMARLTKVKDALLAESRTFKLYFTIGGMPSPITDVSGTYGAISISHQAPPEFAALPTTQTQQAKWQKSWIANNQRLFAVAETDSRDARSAGMAAHRQIGQLLDLIRFEFGAENLVLSSEFGFFEGQIFVLLDLPETIPNPKPARSASDLTAFVSHLDAISGRDQGQSESKDRMLAAFRFYRIGTDVSMFENKLVNWWTAVEYLTRGSKANGSIGAAVENALVPTILLSYLSKHMSALRAALIAFDQPIGAGADAIDVSALKDQTLYEVMKDPARLLVLLSATKTEPYLWHHLTKISQKVKTEPNLASMMKSHERRLRWQVQRLYRARCDIVHSAQNVVMLGLLCANLEYYLRVILTSMLGAFKDVSTLLGPSEFFDRNKYSYERLLAELNAKGGGSPTLARLLQE